MLSDEQLEQRLDDFSAAVRREALAELADRAGTIGDVPAATAGHVNLHAHTFFSYNAYGYSPSRFAWRARRAGLAVAGIVDFDVLDGVDEFLEAGRRLGLKTCASIESRVFVPEFADLVINSPGEPGVAYHMGVGFPGAGDHPFLTAMRQAAQARTRDMAARVDGFLDPVRLDFDRDVRPLTPNGNATERHLCLAYERKAAEVFPDADERARFWTDRLGRAPAEGAELQAAIRAKTMKRGGVGYVAPDGGSFPPMAEMNRVVLEMGAIPTIAWLDGSTDGERQMERFVDVAMASGAAALNIIPDRNYTAGVRDRRLEELLAVVALAERRGLPIVVGTEMNAPGQKFVDDFGTAELAPLLPIFRRGAFIVHAHSVLQRCCGLGYLGEWAARSFASVEAKNAFFETIGRELRPETETRLGGISAEITPDRLLRTLN